MTEDGLFDGTISTRLEDFYIEPVSRYIKQNSSAPNFHTIVYRSSDVSSPQLAQPCASQFLHLNNIASRETTEGPTASVRREGTHADRSGRSWNLEMNEKRTLTIESKRCRGKGFENGIKKPDGKHSFEINQNGLGKKSSEINHINEVVDRDQRVDITDMVRKINREENESLRGGEDCMPDTVSEGDGTPHFGGRTRRKKRSNRWFSDKVTQTTDSIYGRRTTRDASRLDAYYFNPNVFLNASLPCATVAAEVFAARHVHKRATVDPKKTTCMLYLQADHLFYQKYGTEEACIEVMTRHVQRVNSIYKTTGKVHC